MKTIRINIPTTRKEIKDAIIEKIKRIRHPNKRAMNAKIFADIENDICALLNSGYWSNDISETMRERLTCGCPNGEISKIIWSAFRKLK